LLHPVGFFFYELFISNLLEQLLYNLLHGAWIMDYGLWIMLQLNFD